MTARSPARAHRYEVDIVGSEGRIRIQGPFFNAKSLTLFKGGKEEVVEAPYEGNGYQFQALETMRCIRDGKIESDVMPHDETIAIMRTMDQIRAQWDLKYPTE